MARVTREAWTDALTTRRCWYGWVSLLVFEHACDANPPVILRGEEQEFGYCAAARSVRSVRP